MRAGPDFTTYVDPEATAFPCTSGGPSDVGLALSGGGLRATLFHLGALLRLRELGWLERIDRVSSVSGGSIMASILARAWRRLEAQGFSADAFDGLVVRPTLTFAGRHIDIYVIAAGLIPGVNPAALLARWFDREVTQRARLADLPDRPRFIFNASHLATGVSWRISKPYMGDSRLGVVCDPDVALSDAVAASASFPPFVAPFVLGLEDMELQPVKGADLNGVPGLEDLERRVLLLDGGVYDNLAIESIEGSCRIALASDAGGNLRVDPRHGRYRFWWPLLRRTLDMSVEVGRAQRRRALIDRANAARTASPGTRGRSATEHVALWRTSFGVTGHRLLPDGWVVAEGWNDYLASRPTRLWPMPVSDRERLVNWGYLTSDLMLRRWVPDLESAAPPTAWPFPEHTFEEPPPP